jgi:3-oxoacyl-[acyl-carrier-protein] synthase II
VSSGFTSGLVAIGYAAGLIQAGHEQAILAGGVEELCVESLIAFQQAGLLCPSSGPAAEQPAPLDSSRQGIALSEAAALLMLEDFETAQARGANILAEITGCGSSFDCGIGEQGDRAIARRGTCISRSIQAALASAGVTPSAIDALSASAAGERFSDQCEMFGIQQVFNGRSETIPITLSKVAVGESMGASGAVQAVDLIASMQDRRLSQAVIEPDSDSRWRAVSSECRHSEIRHGLINSVGLDGNCCSLVVGGCG